MSSTMSTEAKPNPPSRMGRPSDFTAEVAAEICERLAAGEPLRQICADERLPNRATIMRWLHRHQDFQAQYKLARQLGAEAMADEVIALAMEATPTRTSCGCRSIR